ncbi:MAG: tripartite tricarboxylate transporter substrate binding protein [Burkholderiales bacterium]
MFATIVPRARRFFDVKGHVAASCTLACALLLAATVAGAQAGFPNRPITLVVGFTPGGSNDLIARAVAPKLSEILGVPVVVENKPGASGTIGTAFTANSKPDGHTITLGSTSVLSIAPHTVANIPYKESDLTAVSTVAASASVIAVNPNVPAKSMNELIALAKTKPVSLASAGAGGISHLNIEFIKAETGGNFLHVAYKGAAPGVTDVVGGHVDGIVMDYSALAEMIKQGRMRAVAASKPIEGIPASPMVISPWYGVMAPAQTPKSTLATLHAAFTKALNDPDVRAKLEKMGIEPFVLATPEEAEAYMRADSARWAKVVKESGIKFE